MHEVHFESYPYTMTKDSIVSEVDCNARHHDEYGNGLHTDLQFVDKRLANVHEATRYLDRSLSSFYGCGAVSYYAPVTTKVSSTRLTELQERVAKKQHAYRTLAYENHFANTKVAFIGCKSCGSKINAEYMTQRNSCPVCNTDMRPQSTLTAIAKAKAAWEKAQADYEQERERLLAKQKQELCWLVKYEVHV